MLLRAMLLQAFYSVRSERQLMERMEFDLLLCWFVGLGADEPVWDHSTFSKNRDRLLEGAVLKSSGNSATERPPHLHVVSRLSSGGRRAVPAAGDPPETDRLGYDPDWGIRTRESWKSAARRFWEARGGGFCIGDKHGYGYASYHSHTLGCSWRWRLVRQGTLVLS